MTCIVGMVHEGDVWLGADSAGVGWYDLTVRADEKLFTTATDYFVMGFTTSFRMGQILRWQFTPPEHPFAMSVEEYLSTLFIEQARVCFSHYGWSQKKDNVERGGTFLVGYRGRLAKIDSDFQVGFAADEVDACGCGGDVALGAVLALREVAPAIPPREILGRALRITERCSAGVRGPFLVRHLCEEEDQESTPSTKSTKPQP